VDRIASLVESFNGVLRSANRLLDADGLLRGKDEFARRRQDLVRYADGNADALRSRGIAVRGRVEGSSLSTGRAAFHELSVDAAVLRVREGVSAGLAGASVGGVPGVARALGTLGIVSDEDGTLAIDRGALRGALTGSPDATRKQVADLAGALRDAADAAIAKGKGTLPRLEEALGRSSTDEVRRRVEEAFSASQAGVVRGTLMEVIG
ncbi:MAG: hypothetical protein HY608_00355, partial [Planctomycetes bacterium]|nr:hypothetical protein [Planctomycetota bacterium]